jgi:tetratricopeptide (TPR) repeat protein
MVRQISQQPITGILRSAQAVFAGLTQAITLRLGDRRQSGEKRQRCVLYQPSAKRWETGAFNGIRAESPLYKRVRKFVFAIYGAGLRPFISAIHHSQRFALGWYSIAPLALGIFLPRLKHSPVRAKQKPVPPLQGFFDFSIPNPGLTPWAGLFRAFSALKIYPGMTLRRLGAISAVLLFMATIPSIHAESMASKNKEGNLLFSEGKYAEAEKAYLDAQVKSPGKPEVLYNLGNSLIKQNKSDQGIQSLHQSLSQGNSEIKTRSWYNTGNALFSKGNFQDAAQAYIQTLKLNPTDKDAKHNLELSLMKLNQQNRQQNDPKQKPQNSGNKNQSQPEPKNAGNNSNKQNSPKPSGNQPRELPKQQMGAISKEEAQQILDAFQSRELEEQRKLRERHASQRSNERDW